MMSADKIFDRLWSDYTRQNPSVKKVYDLFISAGEEVKNDHIAFRTFDDPRISIDVLAMPFIKAGYKLKGEYVFEKKHLIAKHFESEQNPDAPRVFISQLITKDFSSELQTIVKNTVDRIPEKILNSDELIYSGRVWGSPSHHTYQSLLNESEYAGWVYANGFQANHFTVSVNTLKKLNSIEKVNNFLKENGFRMNESGGDIKGSPDMLLEQSSIMAENIMLEFEEGMKEVPGCYYEFAKRYKDSQGNLFSGFIAGSADKIFESTNRK